MTQHVGTVRWFNNAKGYGFLGAMTGRMFSAISAPSRQMGTRA